MSNTNFPTMSTNKFYGYTTPLNSGYIKIGQTKGSIEKRVKAQCSQSCTDYEIVFRAEAKNRTDKEFHRFLKKRGYEHLKSDVNKKNEWYKLSIDELKKEFNNFINNIPVAVCEEIEGETTEPTKKGLRYNQNKAKDKIIKAYKDKKYNTFLYNAKCRAGKTFTALSVIKELNLEKVLIVTQRPAICNSWHDDFVKIFGSNSIYSFVTKYKLTTDDAHYITPEEYEKNSLQNEILFMGLSDLKGSTKYSKNTNVFDTKWDIVIVDESHNAFDTEKGHETFDNISTKFTLYLSGTPYKMLEEKDFNDENMESWTYEDEQSRKADGDEDYEEMPELNLITYRPSEEITRVIDKVNAEREMKSAFDLSLFFSLNDTKDRFIYEEDVIKFVKNLHENKNYPFGTEESRNSLKHTVWRVSGVAQARCLAKILRNDEVFKNYEIVEAVGNFHKNDDEKYSDSEITSNYGKVKDAIANNDKTITLTCQQLLEGTTVKEWTAILFLSNTKSKEAYVQSMFRVQNPWHTNVWTKTEAYVFDFDFARALSVHSYFAASGNSKIKSEEREHCIRTLLNYFPVLADDENGEMREYAPSDIITEPIKVIAKDVVKSGFRHPALFNYFTLYSDKNKDIFYKLGGGTPSERKDAKKPEKEKLDVTKPLENQLGTKQYAKLKSALANIGVDYKEYVDDYLKTNIEKNNWTKSMAEDFVNKMNAKASKITNVEEYEKLRDEVAIVVQDKELKRDADEEYDVETKKKNIKSFMNAFCYSITMFDELDMNTYEESFKRQFGKNSDALWKKISKISFDEFKQLRDDDVFNIDVFNESFRQFYRERRNAKNIK